MNYKYLFRIVFITVLVFGCLNHWHWKASIISHLSIVVPETPFKSLEELLDSTYGITAVGDSFYSKFWSAAEDGGIVSAIYKTKMLKDEASFKLNEQEALDQIMSGKYAYFTILAGSKNLPEYKECKIEDVGFSVGKSDSALGFPKTSPYRDLFNYEMRKMMERGELGRIEQKYKPEGLSCGGGGKGRTLGFENIILVFLIFGLGLLLSIVSFLLELAVRIKIH